MLSQKGGGRGGASGGGRDAAVTALCGEPRAGRYGEPEQRPAPGDRSDDAVSLAARAKPPPAPTGR